MAEEPIDRAESIDRKKLVERVKQRDVKAIRLLVDEVTKRLGGFLAGLGVSQGQAEELTRDSVRKIVEAIGGETFEYRGDGQFVKFCRMVALNVYRDFCRQSQRAPILLEHPERVEAPTKPDFPRASPEVRRQYNAVHKTLDLLTAEQREVLMLHDGYNISVKEIAIMLGVTKGAVKGRLNRGRSKFRDEYGGPVPGRVTP